VTPDHIKAQDVGSVERSKYSIGNLKFIMEFCSSTDPYFETALFIERDGGDGTLWNTFKIT
jgi:hypothetical protein